MEETSIENNTKPSKIVDRGIIEKCLRFKRNTRF